jgi:hypothetical protein
MNGLKYWRAHGSPWRPAHPIGQLANLLHGYGYTVGTIGNDAHLAHYPPEDHTPFSATGWPKDAPYGVIFACDIMPPTRRDSPGLAQLGAQLFADRMAAHPGAAWIKYMNWTPAGGACVHDSWMPRHARRPSSDKGHIHLSARTDYADHKLPAGYDPVAACRGTTHEPKPQPPRPPADDWSRRLVMALPQLKTGAAGLPVRRLQALINVAGGRVTVDGAFGPGTEQALRKVQAGAHLGADGIAGPKTWAALLGEHL